MNTKTLLLTLSKQPFDVMKTGKKPIEVRKPSKWILSRLFNPDGTRKEYDLVQFTNGYGNDKPRFEAIFNGFSIASEYSVLTYSNGLTVNVEPGDVLIHLGDIIKRSNTKHY